MAKNGYFEVDGSVLNISGGGFYEVETENGQKVRAKLSGRLRQFKIKVLPGDKVRLEIPEADVTQGRIVYRLNA